MIMSFFITSTQKLLHNCANDILICYLLNSFLDCTNDRGRVGQHTISCTSTCPSTAESRCAFGPLPRQRNCKLHFIAILLLGSSPEKYNSSNSEKVWQTKHNILDNCLQKSRTLRFILNSILFIKKIKFHISFGKKFHTNSAEGKNVHFLTQSESPHVHADCFYMFNNFPPLALL